MKSGRVPSNQVRGFRRVQQVTLTQDNQQFQFDLPRGAAIEEMAVTIDGTFNVTTLYTSVRQVAPTQLIRRLDWRLNGNITLDSISGLGAYICHAAIQRIGDVLTPPGSAAVGLKTIRATMRLPRILVDMFRPKDSVLKTDENVTANQIQIQLGALSDMFVGAGVSAYTGTLTLSVWIRDYQEQADDKGQTPRPIYYWKRSEQIINFSAAGNNITTRVNTGNRLRLILLRFENAGEGANNILSIARLLRGGDTRIDLTQVQLQEQARSISASFSSANADFTGVVGIDFANPGMFGARYSECWPVPSNADVQLSTDILVAATTMRMITLEGVDLQRGPA